jgi:hypothetical protein
MISTHESRNYVCATAARVSVRPLQIWTLISALIFASCLVRPVSAKTQAGISGIVTDSSGALISGATVKATSKETGIVEKRQTNADGFYAFLDLPPGHYDVEVQQSGFNAFRQTDILLDVDSAKVINVKLKVGNVTEQVQVSGEAVQLDTASTQMGEVITGQTMTTVPLVSRSYTDLLALQPGVSPVSSGLAGGQGGQFSATGFTFTSVSGDLNAGNLSVNGQRESANGFLLNGTTVQEFAFSGTAIIPNLDSIAEFRILTNNFDAEYGNYAGGQINVVTKAGSNAYHGSLFEFLRNTDFDARNYFATARDPYQQNQFGGTFGGPIKHDKLFFFIDFQGNHVIQGQTGSLGQIPVASNAERNGDFSAVASQLTGTVQGPAWAQQLSTLAGYTVTQGEPYYFSGCTSATCVFPNAQIPSTMWTTPSKNLLGYIPPVSTVTGGVSYFIPVASPTRLFDDKASGRADYNTAVGMLTGYYFYDQYNQVVPNPLLPGFGSQFRGRSQVVEIGDSKTLGNSSVNDARFGFTRLRYQIHAPLGGYTVTPASLGFPEGPNTLGISPVNNYAHIPGIHFNSFSFGASGGPLGVTESTWQLMDNFSRIIGTHTLTFGGQFRYNQLTEYNVGSNGDFDFTGSETGIDFADFLIGAPAAFSQGQSYPSYGRSRYFGLFGQDSWRIKPNLTLNYGLRWDVSRPWSELHNEIETLVPGLQSVVFPGSPTGWVFPGDPGIPSTLAPTRYDNFAPRIGIAYSPSTSDGLLGVLTGGPGKTSVRAGWGKFYSTFEGATNFNEIGDAPFGNYYGSPVPPDFVTPFVDRGTGHVEGQRFPTPPPPFNVSAKNPDTSINWALNLPIGTSPAFWYKNVLPYTEEYQLSIERQLGPATLLSASYVGAQGHHLLSSLEANPGNPALCLSVSQASEVMAGTQPCGPNQENGVFYPITGGVINGTRSPFGQNFESDGYFITIGESSYNSLQLSIRQRISRLQFLAGYTFSKSLDNASGYGEQINPLDTNQKSLSSFNVEHNFVVSYDFRLPVDLLPGPKRLVQGWALSGITRFSTGEPVTLTEMDDNSLLGTGGAGAISLPVDTPNYTPGSLHFTDPRLQQPYFNTSLFSPETEGQLGTARRRFFAAPGLNNWDIALLKDTTIAEEMRLEFRAEFFNAFNHAQFGQPDGNVNSGTFGLITTANPPRIMQFSLKFLF